MRELALGSQHPLAGVPHAGASGLEQELSYAGAGRARADPDVLRHVSELAEVDVAVGGRQLPGEYAEQRGLADPIGADQPGVLPGAELERDL